jgi:hypothetical protein
MSMIAVAGLTAGLSVLAVSLAVSLWERGPSTGRASTRFTIPLEPNQQLTDAPAISPDGRMLAYAVQKGSGDPHLYLRDLGAFEAREVAGSGGACALFFSPDGKWLAFLAQGQLQKVAVSGGAPIKIAPDTFPFGGTFLEDGSIVHVRDEMSGLVMVRPGDGPAWFRPARVADPAGRRK